MIPRVWSTGSSWQIRCTCPGILYKKTDDVFSISQLEIYHVPHNEGELKKSDGFAAAVVKAAAWSAKPNFYW